MAAALLAAVLSLLCCGAARSGMLQVNGKPSGSGLLHKLACIAAEDEDSEANRILNFLLTTMAVGAIAGAILFHYLIHMMGYEIKRKGQQANAEVTTLCLTRSVNTQSQTTYRRDLSEPRFQLIGPLVTVVDVDKYDGLSQAQRQFGGIGGQATMTKMPAQAKVAGQMVGSIGGARQRDGTPCLYQSQF